MKYIKVSKAHDNSKMGIILIVCVKNLREV